MDRRTADDTANLQYNYVCHMIIVVNSLALTYVHEKELNKTQTPMYFMAAAKNNILFRIFQIYLSFPFAGINLSANQPNCTHPETCCSCNWRAGESTRMFFRLIRQEYPQQQQKQQNWDNIWGWVGGNLGFNYLLLGQS